MSETALPRRAVSRTGGPALIAIVVAGMLSACSGPLPEEGTTVATLYATRCGGCHRPFQPRSMTAAMWDLQLTRMEPVLISNGRPPLTAAEREQILAYLQRNSEGRSAPR